MKASDAEKEARYGDGIDQQKDASWYAKGTDTVSPQITDKGGIEDINSRESKPLSPRARKGV
jgi:hypothetical protein